MEKAKKDVGQKFRRIKHNLVNSSKIENHEDWRNVGELEQRNAKVIQAINTFKKNVSNSIKTGLKEENVDKRRKKVEEFGISADLREGAIDLQRSTSTCLHHVMRKISVALSYVAEEKVKYEMMIEKRVLEDLNQYLELEKHLSRNREKLTNALTDLDIARKSSERTDNSHQENVDFANQKLDNQMDSTVTEIYNLASKEQEIAKVFSAYLEEQLEYHRTALRTIESALPEIRRDIDNARPRPIFGVDLCEHLRHAKKRIAVPIENCCTLLRRIAFTEKGVFRINGNSLKMKRMRASIDAGQIDHDIIYYEHDPHSVCGVLKLYLRELPDPLLTNTLHSEWVHAASLDGEDRLVAMENCLNQLQTEHLDNLTYLIQFLVDLLQHQHETSMNATNLAIVFGPNLLGGDIEENNAISNKIVETFLLNANRLFGVTSNSDQMTTSQNTRSNASLIVVTSEFPRQESPFSQQYSFRQSPRTRPKERAPPPPQANRLVDSWSSDSDPSLIDHNRVSDPGSHTYNRNSLGSVSYLEDADNHNEIGENSMSTSLYSKPHRPPPPVAARTVSRPDVDQLLGIDEPRRNQTTITYLDPSNRTLVSVPAHGPSPTPSVRVKPPLPAKPKPEDHQSYTSL